MDIAEQQRSTPRYVIDYKRPSFFLPIPGQVCYYTWAQCTGTIEEADIKLVKVTKIVTKNHKDDEMMHDIQCVRLNPEDGYQLLPDSALSIKVYTCRQARHRLQIWLPSFMHAEDRWSAEVDPAAAYADVLHVFEHGFGLVNAKYLDLKKEMEALTTSIKKLCEAVAPKIDSSHES